VTLLANQNLERDAFFLSNSKLKKLNQHPLTKPIGIQKLKERKRERKIQIICR
jgi:hypothetical protein